MSDYSVPVSTPSHLLKTIVLGQVLSVLICGTAVSSQYLAEANVETPMLQSFLNYTLLLLTYTTTLSLRRGMSLIQSEWIATKCEIGGMLF